MALSSSAWGCNFPDCAFPAPGTEIFFFDDVWQIGPFGFNKAMILLFIGAFVVIGFFWFAFRKPQVVPRGAQNVGELGYNFISDGIARDVIGRGGEKFVPLLFSFFFFIWILNFMGIVPGVLFPVTSVFAIPVAFALIVYFTWVPLGIKNQGFFGFFKNMMFPPGLPKPLYVILAPIEFISNIVVRPFTHCVRLFANMFAGHLLLTTFTVAAWYLFSATVIGALGSAVSFVVVIALTAFEMLIQALQAYIFTLLTAVYISGALHADH
ncbi:MAG: F0F1 ATP synthase subunit A [Candidatus Nanopelagicales bacterium]